VPGYYGHPDHDHPDFHLGEYTPRPWARGPRPTREELRRLQEQLDEIARAQRATATGR